MSGLMSGAMQGFVVRPPRPEEAGVIHRWFARSDLGVARCFLLGAFGRPGEVPLGAAIARPSRGGAVGHFQVYVIPEARRRGIGRALVGQLYVKALANKAQTLVLAELVGEKESVNGFCAAVGLRPQAKLVSYVLDVRRELEVLEPMVRRFAQHAHLRDMQLVSLGKVDAQRCADFVGRYYSGFSEQQVLAIGTGQYDRAISTVAMRGENICGVVLVRSKAELKSVYAELVLTAPEVRGGPLPLRLLALGSRQALALGKTQCVYEADPEQDAFSAGFATKCGAVATTTRVRYAIDAAGMQRHPT